MNQKEVKCAQILDLLKLSSINQQEASKRIGINMLTDSRLAIGKLGDVNYIA